MDLCSRDGVDAWRRTDQHIGCKTTKSSRVRPDPVRLAQGAGSDAVVVLPPMQCPEPRVQNLVFQMHMRSGVAIELRKGVVQRASSRARTATSLREP